MEEILLDDLYAIRERLLRQMTQALAAQAGKGGLDGLSRRAVQRLQSDVMRHVRAFDLFIEDTRGDIRPGSPFEALMVQWRAVNADIEELEGFGAAASGHIGRN